MLILTIELLQVGSGVFLFISTLYTVHWNSHQFPFQTTQSFTAINQCLEDNAVCSGGLSDRLF